MGPGWCFLEGLEPEFCRRAQSLGRPEPNFWERASESELII